MMTLGEFLQRPLDPQWNCSTEAADYCVSLGHPDFAEKWRGITDPTACQIVSDGILLSLWNEGIGDSLPVAPQPYQMGDIAVLMCRGQEAGAIFTGDKWTLRTDRRRHFIAADDVDVLQVWRP